LIPGWRFAYPGYALTRRREEEKPPFQRGCPPKAGGGLLKKIYRKERKERKQRKKLEFVSRGGVENVEKNVPFSCL